jgi:hypothetical protein
VELIKKKIMTASLIIILEGEYYNRCPKSKEQGNGWWLIKMNLWN